jgi:hypothetical protein
LRFFNDTAKGHPLKIKRKRRESNPIAVADGIAYIELTQGYVTQVDLDDLPLLRSHCWYAHVSRRRDGTVFKVYARASTTGEDGKFRVLPLHRAIMDTQTGLEVDHRDGDGLNNRRDNLRICTGFDNSKNRNMHCRNTCGFKGVSKVKGKWKAKIALRGKSIYLGYYATPEDAALAYDIAAKAHFGDFARTNKDL